VLVRPLCTIVIIVLIFRTIRLDVAFDRFRFG